MLRWTARVGLFLRCLDLRRQPIVSKRGGGFTGTPPAGAVTTKRDPLTASRRYLGLGLSGVAPIEGDGDADVLPVEGAAAAATELRCIIWGGARVVSSSSGIGGNIGSGTGDQRYCSLGRINKGGSRRA